MNKSKKKVKKPTKKKRSTARVEARNAFRIFQRVCKLCDDEIIGDLDNMPIIINYRTGELAGKSEQFETHFDLAQQAIQLLVAMGFSLDGALHIVFSAKETKRMIKEILVKD